eukprot:3937884-Rhodomonas_salina.1
MNPTTLRAAAGLPDLDDMEDKQAGERENLASWYPAASLHEMGTVTYPSMVGQVVAVGGDVSPVADSLVFAFAVSGTDFIFGY